MARTDNTGGGPPPAPKPPKPKTPAAPPRGKGDNSRGRSLHEAKNRGVKDSLSAGVTSTALRRLQAAYQVVNGRKPTLLRPGEKPLTDAELWAAASASQRAAGAGSPPKVRAAAVKTIKDTGDPRGVEVSPNIFMPRDPRGWPYMEVSPGVFVAKDPRGSWVTAKDGSREYRRPKGPPERKWPKGTYSPYDDRSVPELLRPNKYPFAAGWDQSLHPPESSRIYTAGDPWVTDEQVTAQSQLALDVLNAQDPTLPHSQGLLEDLTGIRLPTIDLDPSLMNPALPTPPGTSREDKALAGVVKVLYGLMGLNNMIGGQNFAVQSALTTADREMTRRDLIDQLIARTPGELTGVPEWHGKTVLDDPSFPWLLTAPEPEQDDFKWFGAGKAKAFAGSGVGFGSSPFPPMSGPPAPSGVSSRAARVSDLIDEIITPRSIFGQGNWPAMQGPAAGSSSAPSDDPAETRWLERWVTHHANTCPRCAALGGRVFWSDEGPQPGLHDNCGCERVRA